MENNCDAHTEHIRALKEALASVPTGEAQATELTTREAVKSLRSEVTPLRRKGYSLDMIATVLDKNGFAVVANALRRYRNAE